MTWCIIKMTKSVQSGHASDLILCFILVIIGGYSSKWLDFWT